MADFPSFGGVEVTALGANPVTARGAALTASGTINTKGAYVELLSAANNTKGAAGVAITIEKVEGNLCQTYTDIAIGGAGSEEVIIPDLFYFGDVGFNTICDTFSLPVTIPSGVRISARVQSDVAAVTQNVIVCLGSANFKQSTGLQKPVTYGLVSNTRGTLVAQGSGAYGSWIEIEAATSDEIKGFVVSCHRAASSWSNGGLLYQVAVGSAGNEEIITDGQFAITNGSETGGGLVSAFISAGIPEGSRIAIRSSATSLNSDFTFDFTIHGVA